ncbi:unnamed protein product, partial [Mesorhabditis belari]|uniref:UBC core domain-containing protein n=1 Tax=Mesorhabditis belari TaxID=2138241 RepID=A0AAF3EWG0_9BILA
MYRAARMAVPENQDFESDEHFGVASTSEGAQVEQKMLKLDRAFIAQHALDVEFAIVCRNPLDGIYIIPSASDPFRWFGMLFVRRGDYAGAILRFTIQMPSDFPQTDELPVVHFENEVFHPNVNLKTHELGMSRYFPDGWKRDKHHIYNVLLVVQRIFFSLRVPIEHATNPEAAILYESDKDKFREMVMNCVNQTRVRIYDDPPQIADPNSIWVSPWNSTEHEPQRKLMMLLGKGMGGENQAWSERGHKGGFSWLDPERMTYMTEPFTNAEEEAMDKAATDRAIHGIERLDLSLVNDGEEEIHEKGDQIQQEKQMKKEQNISHKKLALAEKNGDGKREETSDV